MAAGLVALISLFLYAAAESIIWPPPVELVLVPLVLADPPTWPLLFLVAWAGTLAGAVVAYGIGLAGSDWVHRIAGHHLDTVDVLYQRWGAWAVLFAAFTPIPYKVFTLTSGLFRLRFGPFLVASVVGRGLRFGLVAYLTATYGPAGLAIIERLGWAGVAVAAIGAVGVLIWYRRRRGRAEAFAGADEDAERPPSDPGRSGP